MIHASFNSGFNHWQETDDCSSFIRSSKLLSCISARGMPTAKALLNIISFHYFYKRLLWRNPSSLEFPWVPLSSLEFPWVPLSSFKVLYRGAAPVRSIRHLWDMALKNYSEAFVQPWSEVNVINLIIQDSWRFLAGGQKPKASLLPYESWRDFWPKAKNTESFTPRICGPKGRLMRVFIRKTFRQFYLIGLLLLNKLN